MMCRKLSGAMGQKMMLSKGMKKDNTNKKAGTDTILCLSPLGSYCQTAY